MNEDILKKMKMANPTSTPQMGEQPVEDFEQDLVDQTGLAESLRNIILLSKAPTLYPAHLGTNAGYLILRKFRNLNIFSQNVINNHAKNLIPYSLVGVWIMAL